MTLRLQLQCPITATITVTLHLIPVAMLGIEQSVRTRPAPGICAINHARSHRVERNKTQRSQQMRLIHRYTSQAPLPKMTRSLFVRMDTTSVSAVHFGQRTAQGVNRIGNQNQMDMIGHQHQAPHCNAMRSTMTCQHITIRTLVRIGKRMPAGAHCLAGWHGGVCRGLHIEPVAP